MSTGFDFRLLLITRANSKPWVGTCIHQAHNQRMSAISYSTYSPSLEREELDKPRGIPVGSGEIEERKKSYFAQGGEKCVEYITS